jgi:predicted nucleic acid-binding protein
MYLLDTNVISEIRKKEKANAGVIKFFKDARRSKAPVYLSVITIGELRRGIERIRYRGDLEQATLLENWLATILSGYGNFILDFTLDEAQVWGKLRAPNHEHEVDKQLAATALIYDLTVVTRNVAHFEGTGCVLINPFR